MITARDTMLKETIKSQIEDFNDFPTIGEIWYVRITDSPELFKALLIEETKRTIALRAVWFISGELEPPEKGGTRRFEKGTVKFVERVMETRKD